MVTTLAMAHMITSRLVRRMAATADESAEREQRRRALCRPYFVKQRAQHFGGAAMIALLGALMAKAVIAWLEIEAPANLVL